MEKGRIRLKLSGIFNIASGVCLGLFAILTFIHVVGRKAFGFPVPGFIEMTSMGLVLLIFFAFAEVFVQRREMLVDLVAQHFGRKLSAVATTSKRILTVIFFGILAWRGLLNCGRVWHVGESTYGAVAIPLFIPWAALVVGSCIQALVLIMSMWPAPPNRT